jgi:L-arabinose isomerase
MHTKRKIITGFWEDEPVLAKLGSWMRSAVGAIESRKLKVVRFGDNMRNVAVTEGDKVGVQMQLGWQVNTWGVGDLIRELESVTEAEVDAQMQGYQSRYEFATKDLETVRYQAREQVAMRRFLQREGAYAYTIRLKTCSRCASFPVLPARTDGGRIRLRWRRGLESLSHDQPGQAND